MYKKNRNESLDFYRVFCSLPFLISFLASREKMAKIHDEQVQELHRYYQDKLDQSEQSHMEEIIILKSGTIVLCYILRKVLDRFKSKISNVML